MRESLGPSECVALINSLIEGKEAQRDLVEFKEQNSHGGDGTVGLGYWKGFKKEIHTSYTPSEDKNTSWIATSGRLTVISGRCMITSTQS